MSFEANILRDLVDELGDIHACIAEFRKCCIFHGIRRGFQLFINRVFLETGLYPLLNCRVDENLGFTALIGDVIRREEQRYKGQQQ